MLHQLYNSYFGFFLFLTAGTLLPAPGGDPQGQHQKGQESLFPVLHLYHPSFLRPFVWSVRNLIILSF